MSTPMLEQYYSLKAQYPDCLLLFRLGDFYEGFDEDAKTLSRVLGLTLTGRGKEENRQPMAGIPHHALPNYLPKLIKAGYKVAIADQMEEPKAGQIVKRDVTKIISAGTIIDENLLDASDNNYLASIYLIEKKGVQIWGLSFADISTGEFKVTEFLYKGTGGLPRDLIVELYRIRPAELIVPKSLAENVKTIFRDQNLQIIDDNEYYPTDLEKKLLENLQVKTLKGFGVEDMPAAVTAAGKLFQYLSENRKASLPHIRKLSVLNNQDFMLLDEATIRNLELIFPLRENNQQRTLFATLNQCRTPMGQRKLRQWILRPLKNEVLIQERLNLVEEIFNNDALFNDLDSQLAEITDLERVLAKIAGKSANARDLLFLKNGMRASLNILSVINRHKTKYLQKYLAADKALAQIETNVIQLIEKAIKEDPALTITEGDIIKPDYSPELTKIVTEAAEGKQFIQSLQEREIARTGISSLKVRYNKVFGYYIEISRSQLAKVPDSYIRKQTLVNGERYLTEELKNAEGAILGAQEKMMRLEYQIFEKVRAQVLESIQQLQEIIANIAEIDLLTNFAKLSNYNKYVKPEINSDADLKTEIIGGRHPVVESFLKEQFIANDTNFDFKQNAIGIITGPNMAGKSTYIRQVALIFLMCQIGCFVPATKAIISITDRIFTRVGASDNLAGGESTFMVEMNETANILNNASERSLVILDEVGRGTSTYDGVAIAWAIVDFIAQQLKARTLFATHYHELIQLQEIYSNVKNYNIQIVERNSKIIFMHKIVQGGTDKSYGVHVAKLAGLPEEVIVRANEVLEKLQADNLKDLGSFKKVKGRKQIAPEQLGLTIINSVDDTFKKEILAIELEKLTPLQAHTLLQELQEKARNGH